MKQMVFTCLIGLCATPIFADAPVIEAAELRGTTLHVTLSHPDTGWDHYADGWQVTTPKGEILGTRDLAHPRTGHCGWLGGSGVRVTAGLRTADAFIKI